jgi:DNA replicative helicase MCM subunit Mcm2 (Cdc46/Mcm family)
LFFLLFFSQANHIVASKLVVNGFGVTEEDEIEIYKLAKDPQIVNRIIASIAPSVVGNYEVKRAVAVGLFGGTRKLVNKISIRANINVLVVGDPGFLLSFFYFFFIVFLFLFFIFCFFLFVFLNFYFLFFYFETFLFCLVFFF